MKAVMLIAGEGCCCNGETKGPNGGNWDDCGNARGWKAKPLFTSCDDCNELTWATWDCCCTTGCCGWDGCGMLAGAGAAEEDVSNCAADVIVLLLIPLTNEDVLDDALFALTVTDDVVTVLLLVVVDTEVRGVDAFDLDAFACDKVGIMIVITIS